MPYLSALDAIQIHVYLYLYLSVVICVVAYNNNRLFGTAGKAGLIQ